MHLPVKVNITAKWIIILFWKRFSGAHKDRVNLLSFFVQAHGNTVKVGSLIFVLIDKQFWNNKGNKNVTFDCSSALSSWVNNIMIACHWSSIILNLNIITFLKINKPISEPVLGTSLLNFLSNSAEACWKKKYYRLSSLCLNYIKFQHSAIWL